MHRLAFISAPVNMLILSKAYSSSGQTGVVTAHTENTTTLLILRLVENQPSVIRCDALGGYPPPSLDMYIGRRDVTRYFSFKTSCNKVTGSLGQRRFTYSTERSTFNFLPSASDDQQTMSCVATVPGMKPIIESVKLDVDCE